VIDEATQVTEPVTIIPIAKANFQVILVGDHKQLPPTVKTESGKSGLSISLFERLATQSDDGANQNSSVAKMLDTQYRSHPFIFDFPSRFFYDGKLKTGIDPKNRPLPKGFSWPNSKPVAFVPCAGKEKIFSGAKSNREEADLVFKIVKIFIGSKVRSEEIGVITPYKAQRKVIEDLLKSQNILVEVNTVDGFQGREKEVIIISCVRCNTAGNVGFLSDERRFNVMCTRAKCGLIVIGNRPTLECDTLWKQWFKWVDQEKLTLAQFTETK